MANDNWLYVAAGAAIYQGSILSKQADMLKGQLTEMKGSSAQTEKLIQTNLELAAAAKAQSKAAAQNVNINHDNLAMNQRARISITGASYNTLRLHQPLKADIYYMNVGKEPARAIISTELKKWSLEEWQNGTTTVSYIKSSTDQCKDNRDISNGSFSIYPTTGSNNYQISQNSNSPETLYADRFLVDKDIISGKAIVTIISCVTYRTMNQIHHSTSCHYYVAGEVRDATNVILCTDGNEAD